MEAYELDKIKVLATSFRGAIEIAKDAEMRICQGAFLQNTMFLKIAFKIYAEPLVRRRCELSAQWFSFICNHYFSNSRYSCPMKKIFNSF